MSKRKHYPSLGTENATYPYPQTDSVIHQFFHDAMDTMSSGRSDVVYPLYCSVHNTLVRSRAKPKTATDMALALPPADFLLQHEAYCLTSANDSGFENGLVLHSFLAGIRAAAGLKYALVINPPITFSQALRTASIPASYHITCLFDEHTASVYQMDGALKSFRVSTLKDFNQEKNYNNVLIFHHNSSASELKSLLTSLFPNGLPTQCKLYIVLPATALSGQRAESIREFLAKNFPLRHILVVDPNATHVAPSKRAVLTFAQTDGELSIQRAQLSRQKFIHTGPNHSISSRSFIESAKPLHQLCADLEQRSTLTGTRARIKQFSISRHIALMYRIERQRGDKFRVIAYYTATGTPSQQRKNAFGRGKRISKFYRSHSMSSPQEIETYLLELLWDDELSKIIRTDICNNVDSEAIDPPTLWYMYQPELQKNEVYQHNACINFFLSLSPDDSLYCVKLTSPIEFVQSALSDYAQKHSLSSNQQRSLIIQLRLIWNQACIHKYCLTNPFNEIMAVRERKQHERSSLTDASTLRAIEQDCMARLEAFLKKRNDLALNALISLKWHTGLPSSEIAALNWDDWDHMTNMDFNVLMVSKRLPAAGTTPVAFGAVEQNRVIPLPQIAVEIQKYRRAEIKLARTDGIADKEFKQLPMFHVPGDRTRRLTKNGINKMIKAARTALGIEHQYVPLPNGESVEQHDINQYGGDIFRSFFDIRIREAALFRDDSAYLLGTVVRSVACRNYRDYWHPATQLMLHQLQNRCANLHCTPPDIDTTQHAFCVASAENKPLIIRAASVRIQTTITISIPPNADMHALSIQIRCRYGMDVTISYRANN